MTKLVSAAALFAAGLALGTALQAQADQPHMQKALNHLQGALGELQTATHDKGGHRANAVELVQKAIRQVEMGIEAGRGN